MLCKKSETPTAATVRASSYHLPKKVNSMINLTNTNQFVINSITLPVLRQNKAVAITELLNVGVSA